MGKFRDSLSLLDRRPRFRWTPRGGCARFLAGL